MFQAAAISLKATIDGITSRNHDRMVAARKACKARQARLDSELALLKDEEWLDSAVIVMTLERR